jgi:hypothetical protein
MVNVGNLIYVGLQERGCEMARTLTAFCVLVVLVTGTSMSAGEWAMAAEMDVVGTKLTIGMTKAQAFAPFSAYTVQCLDSSNLPPDCDSWFILSNGPPFTPFANLSFKDGKLREVWKYWNRGFEGTDPWKFVATLQAVLAQYAKSGPTQATLETKETKQAGVTQTAIFLTIGNRTVVISTLEGARDPDGKIVPKSVMTYEILR